MERALGLIEPSNDERTEGKVIEIIKRMIGKNK